MFFKLHYGNKLDAYYLYCHILPQLYSGEYRAYGYKDEQVIRPNNVDHVNLDNSDALNRIHQAVDADNRTPRIPPDVATAIGTYVNERASEFLDAFSIFYWPLPEAPISLGLIRYGTGGNYHLRRDPRRLPDVTIRVQDIETTLDGTFPQIVETLAHEMIHQIIEVPLVQNHEDLREDHLQKEGIVNQIQRCQQFAGLCPNHRFPTPRFATRKTAWSRDWLEEIPWVTTPIF